MSDIFTLDENNNAAVRTVGVKAGATESNQPDIFTTDENGNACIRVTGSGGGVDETKVIVLSDTIPEADASNLGKFYCYKGTTNANYTHGYVYECVAGSAYYEANIAFDRSTFASESFEKAGQLIVDAGVADPTEVTGGTMTYALAGNLWTIVFTDENGDALNTGYSIYTDDLEQDYDILPVIDPSEFVDGQVVGMAINNVVEHHDYSWERVDLQPAAKLGRYLAGWNCATGLAMTNPPESPYEYTTGDYFIVGVVATGGASNYKPDGSSYTTGVASTTVESESVSVNDMYLYDGTNWTLLKTGSAVTSVNGQVGDVTIEINDILPTQTGNAGKFLTTDGTDASWSDKPLVNNSTNTNALAIGNNTASGSHTTTVGAFAWNSLATYGTSVGYNSSVSGTGSVAIGANAHASGAHSIQISSDGDTQIYNNDANTFKVANDNGNFEIMSADGTIPKARLVNALSSTTVTIGVADWNGGTTASKTINGLTATSVVFVAPDNASESDYLDSGVYASAQTTDTLTFTCTTTPTSSLTVTVVFC